MLDFLIYFEGHVRKSTGFLWEEGPGSVMLDAGEKIAESLRRLLAIYEESWKRVWTIGFSIY